MYVCACFGAGSVIVAFSAVGASSGALIEGI